MRTLRLLHRWAGGLIGLLLALLGLTGTFLLHKDAWLRASLLHATDSQLQDVASLSAAAERIFADPAERPRSVVLATDGFGLHRLYYQGEAGAYADQSGRIVERWSSIWERPEVWLFEIHHHLLAGETGTMVTGVAGLAGLIFVVTGLILWWPTRRLFAPRAWPDKLDRPAIVRHHRDLGVIAAPVLVLSLLTGVTMTLDPVADALYGLLSPRAEIDAARALPKAKGGPVADSIPWRAMIEAARERYPDGEIRVLALPAKPGALVSMRVRQPPEWLPNGRTFAWFDAEDGRMVSTRSALALPRALQVANAEYPLHAAKVGGLAYRLLMTVSGLALTLLGSLAVLSFWGNPSGLPKRRKAPRPKGEPLKA